MEIKNVTAVPSHAGLQTVALKVKQVPLQDCTLGLLMMGRK
jgi:hypothetical protein